MRLNGVFVYGIDLAENLNYFASVCMRVSTIKAYLHDIVKLKDTNYPALENILLYDQFKKHPPEKGGVFIDYTNEKSFSENVETKLHPAFANPRHENYNKWRWLVPYTFGPESKLALKQNAKQMMQNREFVWPRQELCSLQKRELVEELQEQLLRETAEPGRGDDAPMRFPKPEGYDNDLAVAFELALMAAKRFIGKSSGSNMPTEEDGSPISAGISLEDYYAQLEFEYNSPAEPMYNVTRNVENNLGFGTQITGVGVEYPEHE